MIDEHQQGKGLGKTLAGNMIEWAKEKGFRKIWLTVFSDKKRPINLYKSLGFGIEGIFMRNDKLDQNYRHVLSMALFFDYNPSIERDELKKTLVNEFGFED